MLSLCRLVRSFVRQILLPRYLMNSLCSLHETYSEYLLASTDNLVRFCRSKVKVAKTSISRRDSLKGFRNYGGFTSRCISTKFAMSPSDDTMRRMRTS